MASIFDLFSNTNAQDAANAQISALQSANQQGQNYLAGGLNNATNSYTAGLQPFMSNYNQANAGTTALGNLLGLNGAAGNASATQQLQNTPGYQFALDQGTQNVLRNQAATGQLASGATNVDLQNQGIGTATNAAYAPYLSALQQYLPAANQAATGIGTLYSGLAGTQTGTAANQANMAYGSQVGQGNAQASADLANNAAAGNMFGALKSGMSLGSTLLGFL